jgi:flagellar hook protein FlgE
MIRSMFTAVNSLYINQQYMDVVADNLSNVNTPGFKSSTVRFKDQFAQTMRVGSAPSTALGGLNPMQVGLGTNLASISPNFSQGALNSTGRDMDMAISGDGFFIYNNGVRDLYSRDGSLAIDSQGYLVHSSSGDRIQGWMANGLGVINTGSPMQALSVPIDSTVARATTKAYVLGNLDAGTTIPDATAVPPVAAGHYDVTMGVYDALGVLQPVSVRYTRTTNPLVWNWAPTTSGVTVIDTAGATMANGTITFDSDGQWVSTTGRLNVPASPGATTPTRVDMNLEGMTMLATANGAALGSQDGLAAGSLMGFNVSSNTGEIYGAYSNGDQRLIGQLALAMFVNPSGLIRQGGNSYAAGLNSGEPRVGAPAAGGRGTVASGYVEGSNVDMSREFANMILAQRGFQASSRVINTSDQMLQELVNLGR